MTSRSERLLHCIIADAGRTFYDGPAYSVILPGEGGAAEVLPGHAEAFIALTEGDIVYWTDEHADEERVPVKGGAAHVLDDRLAVLL